MCIWTRRSSSGHLHQVPIYAPPASTTTAKCGALVLLDAVHDGCATACRPCQEPVSYQQPSTDA